MNKIIPALILAMAVPLASAQERLPRREALKLAFLVSADLKALQATPIATDVDLKHPVALRDGDYGALVLPESKLSAETIAKAGDRVAPLGQLWLHRLTPIRDGVAVPPSELHVVQVETEGESHAAVQLALGVRSNGSGGQELLVFGKGKTPLLTLTLKKAEGQPEPPISIEAVRLNDETGRITFRILGRYEASLMVTELGQ